MRYRKSSEAPAENCSRRRFLTVNRSLFEVRLNWNVFGRIDTKSHPISTYFKNCDFYFVSNNNGFRLFPSNNQHQSVVNLLLVSLP